jgi:peptidoglycan/LPS O-acetylase OafA/YrhL
MAGRASYPLYLLHQTIGLDLMQKYYRPGVLGLLFCAGLVAAMVLLSVVIAECLEQPVIQWLKRRLARPAPLPAPAMR